MVYRIYVEKKPGFDGEAQSLRNELVSLLGIKELNGLRLLNRYDVEGIDSAPTLPPSASSSSARATARWCALPASTCWKAP